MNQLDDDPLSPSTKKRRTVSTTDDKHRQHWSFKETNPLKNDDVLRCVFSFVPESYRFVASVNRRFRNLYRQEYHNSTATSMKTTSVESIGTTQIYLMDEWHRSGELQTGNGTSTLWQFLDHNPSVGIAATETAAKHGEVGTLQWLRAQTPPCPWGTRFAGLLQGTGR